MLCIFFGFVMILSSLKDDPLMQEIIPIKIIELLSYAFFLLQLLSTTIAGIGNIYNAKNMDLFLSVPLSTPKLFVSKFFETLIETSTMFAVFALPVGFAYLWSVDVHPGFLPAAFVLAIPFLVIPTSFAIVLGTFFVRVSTFVWKRGLFLLVCLFAAIIWGIFNLFSLLSEVQIQQGGGNAIVQLIGLFGNPNPIWMPSRWVADLLSYFITGVVIDADLKIALLCSTAIGSFAIAYLTFDFFHAQGEINCLNSFWLRKIRKHSRTNLW